MSFLHKQPIEAKPLYANYTVSTSARSSPMLIEFMSVSPMFSDFIDFYAFSHAHGCCCSLTFSGDHRFSIGFPTTFVDFHRLSRISSISTVFPELGSAY